MALTQALAAAHGREEKLLALVAEKDAQIRMVLEDRFYKPVVTDPKERPQPSLAAVSAAPDATFFDPEADARQLAEQDKLAAEAQRRLDAALEGAFQGVAAEARSETPGLPSAADLNGVAAEHEIAERTAVPEPAWQPEQRVTEESPLPSAQYPNAGRIEVLDTREVDVAPQTSAPRKRSERSAAALEELAQA